MKEVVKKLQLALLNMKNSMKKLRGENQLQLEYIEKLFDEKLVVVDEKLKNIDYKVSKLVVSIEGNGRKGLLGEVDDIKTWKNTFMGQLIGIGIVVGITGNLFLIFIKEVIGKFYK